MVAKHFRYLKYIMSSMLHLKRKRLQSYISMLKITLTVAVCEFVTCAYRNQIQTRLHWQRSYPPPTMALLSSWHYKGTRSVFVFIVSMGFIGKT